MLADAHCHFHDARLAPWKDAALREARALGLRAAVVNGTREEDWPAVAELAREHDWVLPSFGLHPWHVPSRSPQWMEKMRAQLEAHPRTAVGEIGLDRWVQGHNLPEQIECFRAQLALAVERKLPVTVHCLRAWGALWEVLQACEVPPQGFLLHAYGGSREMAEAFAKRGAYFSYSPSFLHERKAAQRALFAELPADRILVETDAPDLAPPRECTAHRLEAEGEREDAGRPFLNHPANIALAYASLAEVRGIPQAELERCVEENYARLFLERPRQ